MSRYTLAIALLLVSSIASASNGASPQVNSWFHAGYLVKGGVAPSETDSHALTITITKKFVRLPEKKQREILFKVCEEASAALSEEVDFSDCYALWPDKVSPTIATVSLIAELAEGYGDLDRVDFEGWYLRALRTRDLGK